MTLCGGRARAARSAAPKKSTVSRAVPALVAVNSRYETAAQKVFEMMILHARTQKKRQIQKALTAALKRQKEVTHEVTARQQRYAANRSNASIELDRVAATREAREQARLAAAAAATGDVVGPKGRPRKHAETPARSGTLTDMQQKRRNEEVAAFQFFDTIAKLQRQRQEQIAHALNSVLTSNSAKGRAKKEARLASVDAGEATAAEAEVEWSGAMNEGAAVDAAVAAVLAEKKYSARGKRHTAPKVEAINFTDDEELERVDLESFAAASGDTSDELDAPEALAWEEPEEEETEAEAEFLPTPKVRQRAAAIASQPEARLPSGDADMARAAYFDIVRKRVDSKLLSQTIIDAARAGESTPVVHSSPSYSNWPTPESSTGLFRL